MAIRIACSTPGFGDREQLPDARTPIDADYDNLYTGNSGAGTKAAPISAAVGPGQLASAQAAATSPDEDGDFQESPFARNHPARASGATTRIEIADLRPTERLIGLQIIDLIDEAGYVRGDLEAL
ncbi:MAG: hypothetical protein R3D05_21870 [Dongiaceae bacterium]